MPDDWALSFLATQIEKLTHVHIMATSKKSRFLSKNTLFENLDDFLRFLAIIVSREDALIRQDGLGNNEADLDEFYAKTQ